jgi:hypothetical protein
MSADDFYVPDEPVEDVIAAYERGEKRVTARPSNGKTEQLRVPGLSWFVPFKKLPTAATGSTVQ